MPNSGSSPEERLELFIRACNYRGDLGRIPAHGVVGMLNRICVGTVGELPAEDRRLVKLAAAALSFVREVRRVSVEEPELDFREEEILRVVQESLRKGEN